MNGCIGLISRVVEERILAYKQNNQLPVACIAIFHKYCGYIKYGVFSGHNAQLKDSSRDFIGNLSVKITLYSIKQHTLLPRIAEIFGFRPLVKEDYNNCHLLHLMSNCVKMCKCCH